MKAVHIRLIKVRSLPAGISSVGYYTHRTSTVCLSPSETAYIALAHELGHASYGHKRREGPDGLGGRCHLAEELLAWAWALKRLPRLTTEERKMIRLCVRSYMSWCPHQEAYILARQLCSAL